MKIIAESWIRKPDENGDGFLQAELPDLFFGVPVPIETHHVAVEEVKMGEEQDFTMVFESAAEITVFKDDKEYVQQSRHSMAAESYIPSGLFSPEGKDKDFVQKPTVIISGHVTKTYDDPTAFGFRKEDTLCSISCGGEEFDLVIHKEIAEVNTLSVGNVIGGVFWVQGWPTGA